MAKKKEDQKFAWGKGDVTVTLPSNKPKVDEDEQKYLAEDEKKSSK